MEGRLLVVEHLMFRTSKWPTASCGGRRVDRGNTLLLRAFWANAFQRRPRPPNAVTQHFLLSAPTPSRHEQHVSPSWGGLVKTRPGVEGVLSTVFPPGIE